MKYAIIGSRTFNDYDYLKSCLKDFDISEIISGGAKGADSMAEKYAIENDIKCTIFLPDWKLHGRGAGFMRNKLIIDNSNMVIAFWDGISKGTKNSIDIANKQNKKIYIFNEAGKKLF